MKKLDILIDLDGVVSDTLPTWLLRIYEKTGVLANVNDITSWELPTCPPLNTLPVSTIVDILNEPGFTLGLPVLGNACENLRRLHEAGHNIYFVTARFGPVTMPETLSWMRKHFPWVNPERQVCFVHDKRLMCGDILIDDKAETLVAYRQSHPYTSLLTIAYPYNRNLDSDLGVQEFAYASDVWDNIRTHIEGMANEQSLLIH